MANFCKYCGKALQEGEICSCPQAQAEAAQQYQGQQPQQPPQGYQPQQPPQGYQQPPQGYPQPQPQGYPPMQPAAPNPFVLALQKIVPYIQSYIKAPVISAQNLVAQKDITFAGVLLCIQAIVGGLLLFSLIGSYLNNIMGVIMIPMFVLMKPLIGDSIDDILDLDEIEAASSFSASFPMSLLFGILATVAAIAIFVVIAFAVSKIAGSNCSIQDVIVASAAHTPFVTLLMLLSFLFFLFFMPLGVIFLVIAMLTWMVLAIPTFQTLAPNAPQSKFWVCTIVGVLAALLIGGIAAYSIGSVAVGSATYKDGKETYTIAEMREEIRGFGSLLGGLF